MTTVSLICACQDDERAHAIRKRLIAEGHDVIIAHREVDLGNWNNRGKGCTVALWSSNSVDSWPVRQIARAADAERALVHVALQLPVSPPITSTSAPVDLSRWNGENSPQWRLFAERIARTEQRDEAQAQSHHFFAMMALAAGSFVLTGLSASLRMEDGAAPTPSISFGATQYSAGSLPQPEIYVGGPEKFEPALEPETIDVDLIRASRISQVRAAALPDLARPLPLADVAIRRPGLLGQILSLPGRIIENVAS